MYRVFFTLEDLHGVIGGMALRRYPARIPDGVMQLPRTY